MKYPFEDVTVLGLIRHPFEENDGEPASRSYMRLLSFVVFAGYILCQVHIPIKFFLNRYYIDEAPLLMTIMLSISVMVGVFVLYLLLAALTRYLTSLYFLKNVRVDILLLIVRCTREKSSKKAKRQEKLDAAMVELGIVKVETSGKVLSLEDIANPAMDFDAIDSGVSLYMEDYKGKYSGKNIAALFLFLSEKKLILSDNLALFYRILNSRYPDNSWVSDNAVLKGVNGMAGGEKLPELQKGIAKKYFSQIQID